MSDLLSCVTYGRKINLSKTRLQAVCSPLQYPSQLEDILQFLCKEPRLTNVTDKILAFRTEQEEGYDDGGFLGAGEKLLHMLERMNVENIVMMVFFWDYGHIGNSNQQLFKEVLDSGRQLILQLHNQLFKQENTIQSDFVTGSALIQFDPPPVKVERQEQSRHFLSNLKPKKVPEIPVPYVTEPELFAAINQVEGAIRSLSTKDIAQLRTCANLPNTGKVLQAVAVLKGSTVITWPAIRQMLNSRTLKLELASINVNKLSTQQVKKCRALVSQLKMQQVSKECLAASGLLSWVQGLLTWHAGRFLMKPEESERQLSHQPKLDVEEEQPPPRSPEYEEKFQRALKFKQEQEEIIQRVLNQRVEEDFQGDKSHLTDEEILQLLNSEDLYQQPTSVLSSLVNRLRDKRLDNNGNQKYGFKNSNWQMADQIDDSRVFDEEYFRALKQHDVIKSLNSETYEIPNHVEYAIDKAVRNRLRQGQFGLDHSMLITLQMEIDDSFVKGTSNFKSQQMRQIEQSQFVENLIRKLSNKETQNNFENWKKRKTTEERLRKKLIWRALKENWYSKILQRDEAQAREDISRLKVYEWNQRKISEARKKSKEKRKMRVCSQKERRQKLQAAQTEYRNWLRDSFIKLKYEKQRQIRLKNKEKKEQRQQKREKKLKAQEAFERFLRRKKVYRREEKFYEPINLSYRGLPAYSLNDRIKLNKTQYCY